MEKYIKVVAACPFIGGKPCIKDGWKCNTNTMYPCMFYDTDISYNGRLPDEPCRIKRAINRILSDEIPDKPGNEPIEMPWTTERS